MTHADASVAWPHHSTSTAGVNHLGRQPSPSATKKAVSDRLFSRAIACIVASSSHASRGQMAAGLPADNVSVNAPTW